MQSCRRYVAPVDDPIEGVELGGVFEGIQNKRDEAEDVKVGRLGRRPAPEENVDSDAEVDQSDEAQTLVDGAVCGLEDDLYVEFGGALLDRTYGLSGLKDRIGGVGPDAAAEGLADEGSQPVGWPVVDAYEDVAFAYSGALTGRVGGNTARPVDPPWSFNPPDAVGRNVEAVLTLEVHRGEHASGQRRQCECDCQNTRLGSVLHTPSIMH